MRILAITRDVAFLRQCRLAMPLANLKRQGLIDDYHLTNPSLFDLPEDTRFDAVWLQRSDHLFLVKHIARRTEGRFLYDLDDLLLGAPGYEARHLANTQTISQALEWCAVLATTSDRLVGHLETATGLELAAKGVICPNGFEFPAAGRAPEQPQALVLTSSADLALTESKAAFVQGVAAFAARRQLPAYCFGRPSPELLAALPLVKPMGMVPFWHYHALLAGLPQCLGLAPLETRGDPGTMAYVDSKSDVKMAEYAGHGHHSVYSAARPYAESDLAAGLLTDNTAEAWEESLEAAYTSGWKQAAQEREQVLAQRHMDVLARECWLPALERAQLPRPLGAKELGFGSGPIRRLRSAFKYLVYNQPPATAERLKSLVPSFVRKLLKRV